MNKLSSQSLIQSQNKKYCLFIILEQLCKVSWKKDKHRIFIFYAHKRDKVPAQLLAGF
jgi:hypothetical protein